MNAKLQISEGMTGFYWYLSVRSGRSLIYIDNDCRYPSRKAARRAVKRVAEKFGLTIVGVPPE